MAGPAAIDPLLWRALGFPRRALGWAVAVCLATAALALASATPPLVADAAADRSFVAEVAAAQGAPPGRALDARAVTTGIEDADAVGAVSDVLDGMDVYGDAVARVSPLLPYTDLSGPLPQLRTADGGEVVAVVFAMDGAVESFGGSATAGPSIWVPDTSATELGIEVGDDVSVALFRPLATEETTIPPVPVTVAGIYPTDRGLPVSDGIDWSALPGGVPIDPVARTGPANLLITDRETAVSLIDAMGDTTLVVWDVPWDAPVDVQRGRDATAALDDADLQLIATDSPVGQQVTDAGGEQVELNSGVDEFVDRSERAAAALQPLVSSIAVTARVMSAMVLAIGIWLLTRNRRREHQLSMSMGIQPLRLAATTLLEVLLPMVLGIAVALAVVRWHPRWVAGNGSIDSRTIDAALVSVRNVLVVAAAVVLVAAFAAVWPLEPSAAGRARRAAAAVHFDTIVIVAAVATGAQLLTQRGQALDSGSSLLFPMFATLAGAVIVVRVIGLLMRYAASRRRRVGHERRTRRPRSLAWWLAARRTTAWLAELSALVVVVAAGVGLFAYSTSVAVNGERGIDDKAAALGGATTTVQIASTEPMAIGTDGMPTGLPAGWSVLWATTSASVGSNLVTDLLLVDPDTFGDAAQWRPSFADRPLPELLAEIDDGNATTLDVVLAGNYNDQFPDEGTLELDRAFVRYRVVARIAAAPWIRERASIMLVSANRMADVLPVDPNVDPPLTPAQTMDQRFRTYFWADEPAAGVLPLLGRNALPDATPDTVTAARTPEFVAFGMSLPYLRIVGFGLLGVALVSIVVLGARRRSDLALEIAMTDRMGLRRGTTALAVAGGAVLLGLIGSVIGIVIADRLVAFMLPRLDPGPSFAPGVAGGLTWRAVGAAVGTVVVVSVLGALLEVRGARRARVVEVLRAAE